MRPKRGRKIKITELNFKLWTNYETATASISLLPPPLFPCAQPTGGAVRRRGHLTTPPPKTSPAPLVCMNPAFPGSSRPRHAPPPTPLRDTPPTASRSPATSPSPSLARPPPGRCVPARPPPHPWPIKGQHDPSRAPRELEPPPPWPASARAPWSRRSAPPRLQ